MKLYFAKLLPTEGEIKEGDWYETLVIGLPKQREAGTHPKWTGPTKHTGRDVDKITALMLPEHKRKLKLFLCSRDIQVGDKFFFEPNPIYHSEKEQTFGRLEEKLLEENPLLPKYIYKVIGEISLDATWVKEGDEFDENEINRQAYDDSGSSDFPWFDYFDDDDLEPWEKYPEKYKRVQIKGPCGHFH